MHKSPLPNHLPQQPSKELATVGAVTYIIISLTALKININIERTIYMYYATFKNAGVADILEFETEDQRNDWVDFKDPFSALLNKNKNNSAFQRKEMTELEVINQENLFVHVKRWDGFYNCMTYVPIFNRA